MDAFISLIVGGGGRAAGAGSSSDAQRSTTSGSLTASALTDVGGVAADVGSTLAFFFAPPPQKSWSVRPGAAAFLARDAPVTRPSAFDRAASSRPRATASGAAAVSGATQAAAPAPSTTSGMRPEPKPSLLRARSPRREVCFASVVKMTNSSSPIANPRTKKMPSSARRQVTPSTNEVTTTAQRPFGAIAAARQVVLPIQPSKTQWQRSRRTPKDLVRSVRPASDATTVGYASRSLAFFVVPVAYGSGTASSTAQPAARTRPPTAAAPTVIPARPHIWLRARTGAGARVSAQERVRARTGAGSRGSQRTSGQAATLSTCEARPGTRTRVHGSCRRRRRRTGRRTGPEGRELDKLSASSKSLEPRRPLRRRRKRASDAPEIA
mmetsp:Transcript_29790/g.92162  ORF Transcript_29790/g.92162 Transcript_29790/m.92162 type:complete len:381 (-) Transcript_29790:589-1731(-)